MSEMKWISVEERLPEPGQIVLAAEKGRVLRAMYAPHQSLDCDKWGDFEPEPDYDEATDTYYWPEGWYENNQHEEIHWSLDSDPTHWMPLPAPPNEMTQLPTKES